MILERYESPFSVTAIVLISFFVSIIELTAVVSSTAFAPPKAGYQLLIPTFPPVRLLVLVPFNVRLSVVFVGVVAALVIVTAPTPTPPSVKFVSALLLIVVAP